MLKNNKFLVFFKNLCYTLVGDRMEKKKSTTKSNKKGTNVSAKKNTTSKKVAPTKKTNTTKEDTTVKTETIKKVVETKKVKEEKEINMARPINIKQVEASDEFAGNEIRKLLIIIGAVCAVMLSFYFITEFVIKNKKDDNTNNDTPKTETVIQYEEILMGSSLNQGSGEYYVFAYLEDDDMLNVYNSYIDSYNKIDGHKKVYKVNLSNDFNKSYVSGTDEYYLEGSDVSKIKVRGTTLIKVIDNSISYSYRNSDTIIDKLTRLIG